MTDKVKFAVGGPVQAKKGTYLPRQADEDLFEACLDREFAYILACRQIGKSSLMFETAKKLRAKGVRAVVVDLDEIGKGANQDQWYFSLMHMMARGLKLEVDVNTWWKTTPDLSTSTQRFLQFLREVALRGVSEPIVIFVDEIDTTLELDFTDDFFAAIRTLYHERAENEDCQRLAFVLLGAAAPDELVADDTRTPFNIGREITLSDFTAEECRPFRGEIEARYPELGGDYFNQIYTWTNGHPYFTQKLCAAILESAGDEPDLVDTLVRQLFLAPGGRDDTNFRTVEKSVTSALYASEMLRVYRQVLAAEEPVLYDEKSLAINRLKLYGLVIIENNQLKVRNKLYARVFDAVWANEKLKESAGPGLPRRYKIVQVLGQGGFATVYLTQETLESGETRHVAVKVLDLEEDAVLDWTGAVRQFERESNIIASLEHPNIARVFHTERSEATHPEKQSLFIAMEYIPGGTLSDKLKEEGPLPRGEAVNIIRQIGDALAHAHAEGVIHCDVKPSNILLDTSEEPVRPVLTDFGLVKLLSEDDQYIASGGTHRYMAPEQWRREAVTPATDVYALALIFFEVLAGWPPFEANLLPAIKDQHLNQPLPPLSGVAPQVGSLFDEVLIKAAAKDPSDRYQSTTEFVNEIEAAIEQEKQSLAADVLETARAYVRRGKHNVALGMIEAALQDYPGYVDALRLKGEIRLSQEQPEEAFESYRQAYEQDANPASETGRGYLRVLKDLVGRAWEREADEVVVEYYRVIKQTLDEGRQAGLPVGVWQEAWTELVQDHYQQGVEAYGVGQPADVSGTTSILNRHVKALEALGAERESWDLRDKRKALLKILRVDSHYREALKAYEEATPANMAEVIGVLDRAIETLEGVEAVGESQDLKDKRRQLQVKRHYAEAQEAYAAGNPENITEALQVLDGAIESLGELGAADEVQELKGWKKELEVKECEGVIETERKAIAEAGDPAGRVPFTSEDVFQHYQRIDEAYQRLIELEAGDQQWTEGRRANLREEARNRLLFATHALEGSEPDYEVALRCYRRILEIAQVVGEKWVAQELGVDNLQGIIERLENESVYDEKYRKALELLGSKKYSMAADYLQEEFIQPGNHEYRDVSQLLAVATYAKQHNGEYPPWWDSAQKPRLKKPGLIALAIFIGVLLITLLIVPGVGPFPGVWPKPTMPMPTPTALCCDDLESNLECWQYGGELESSVKREEGQCFVVLGDPDYPCGDGVPRGEAWITQTFTVPQGVSSTLLLNYRVFSYDLDIAPDYFQVAINGEPFSERYGNDEWNEPSCDGEPWDSGWQSLELDLGAYRGEEIEISFHNVNGNDHYNTWTYISDVRIDEAR